MLSHEFPPWSTVYRYYRPWRCDGTWEKIHDSLHEQVRQHAGRTAQPSAGIIRQSDGQDHRKKGVCEYDAGKKIKERKRHIL